MGASPALISKIAKRKEEVMVLNTMLKKNRLAKAEHTSQKDDQEALSQLDQILNN